MGCTNPLRNVPTYEFTCPDGHDFDKFFRSMANAPSVVPCPMCGAPAERQMSAGAGLVFHGSGFYITDYGKDGKKDQQPAAKSSDAKSDATAATPATGAAEPKGDAKADGGSSGSEAKPATESSVKSAEAAPKSSPAPKAAE